MTDDDLYLWAGLVAAALLLWRAPLSPLRRRIVNDIVPMFVPSTYPDARFHAMYPGYDPNDPDLPERFTTCAALPSAVGRELGYRDGITRYGTFAVRNIGQDTGTWVD